ncbi:YhdP family protein [Actimicrobium sp. CCI2.3]|uniref:YhdP family protein n=1 Tax=Actimicrobium sp. CCI2.3 TaxID=3048616 RepID=UPI002AB4390D|nr:YhdP family protein [Actimicrobium sp. CCI2.3]MDY7575848.1 YhdP family protein [Actimicrobium sp. CCI2.3]MEB0021661.1 YhdP family protein [Actimicrobium sp. CCI2.3]
MTGPDRTPAAPAGQRLAKSWRTVVRGYRYVNVATYHTVGALLKLLLALYLLLCVVFLLMRYLVLPNIDQYKPDVEQLASRAIGQSVSIGTIAAAWHGLYPDLVLGNVVIHDQRGEAALTLPKVEATLSWWSVVVADLRLRRLTLDQPDIDIVRDKQGRILVAGIAIDSGKPGDSAAADWILAQDEIVIRSGQLHWIDQQRGAPELILQQMDFTLRNSWRNHQVALKAVPPVALAAPLDVRATFSHPHFSKPTADPRQWRGELYADLRETDLAAWKTWIDFPFDLQSGRGTVRAWLNIDRARIANLTADIDVAGVVTRLREDLQPLNLKRASGRISVREALNARTAIGIPTFGVHGHTIALTDFSMETDDGLQLPLTTISETYIAATAKEPEKIQIQARLLELATLASLVERLPLPAAQQQMLADFAPRGQLQDFQASWQGAYPAITTYNIKGKFTGLSLSAQPARAAQPRTATRAALAAVPSIPGFDNLSGNIDASERRGALNLASTQVAVRLPGYLSDPLVPFEQLTLQSRWAFQSDDQLLLQIDQLDFLQDGVQVKASGQHLLSLLANDTTPGTMDMTATIAAVDINRVARYLPLQTPGPLRDWLTGALQQGQARDVVVRIKGDLAQFPFATSRSGEKPKGIFTVNARIDNGAMLYVPGFFGADGKAPLWPLLEKVRGTLLIDRARLEIRGDSAVTKDVALAKVRAVVPDLLSTDPQLEIDGEASGNLQDMVRYVNASPVLEWIGRFTDETKAVGPAKLALKLRLPLDHLIDGKVTGALQFLGNDVTLQNAIPLLGQTTGKLEFNERGFTLNGVRARFLGAQSTIAGGSQENGNIVVKADGSVTADGLRETYPDPALQRLLQKITGASRYNATISVKKKLAEVVVESSLQGLALDLPVPLRKSAVESLPLRVELAELPADTGQNLREEIKLSLGSAVSARYLRAKAAEKNAPWQVVRGGIGVNSPPPEPAEGLHLNVSLRTLNIDDWRALVSSAESTEKPRDPTFAAGAASGLALAQFVQPDVMAARATELIISGKRLDNVVVGVSRQNNVWQANIDSGQASGYLTWTESPSGRGLGKVTARLSTLTIPQSAATEVADILENKETATQIPALDVIAENFQLIGKPFGRLELRANNAFGVSGSEWRISKLSIANPDGTLNASGKFTTKEGKSVSNLIYALDIADAGKLLGRFGFDNVLRGGKGQMKGDLTWDGVPFSLDIPSLTGQIELDLEAGQFLKVDPGAAKLLGVLSLQSLPRRLTLDFRDVFSQGFAFDGINANAVISQGIASTNNFKMRSVNASVLLDGSVNIASETQNLHVVVLPEINVGAASVVYALAVNPIIGVGSFLAQLFLRDPLMRAFTFEYAITGPWNEPLVTKLDRKTGADPLPVEAAKKDKP